MSKIEEMSAKYADERLSLLRPDISDSSYFRHTKMTLDLFDGYELESAYEEGAKAMLEEIEDVLHEFNEDDPIFCHYINIVDKINELKQQ